MKRTFLILSLFAALAFGLRADPKPLNLVSADQKITISAEEFAKLPHVEATVFDAHEKKTHLYSGVPIRDLLAKIGAPLGAALRGPNLRTVVIAKAEDGYEVAFALAEFDESFSDRVIILADRQDGQALPEGMGPFRVIAPGDKRPARWARMTTSLEVIKDVRH